MQLTLFSPKNLLTQIVNRSMHLLALELEACMYVNNFQATAHILAIYLPLFQLKCKK